ncbi:helix-turn-helix transcriptional regulator [Kitasatospora sp. NPDC048194]|uniref:helix-turn-helix transcriptional regulator n=1 Tax=Kitasatospora sp. NPDC048194 TaxID=3364045 RepID=UPI0037137216
MTGQRIRRARRLQRLTQEGLAERSGLHRKTISKIELGEAMLTHDHLAQVAHGLGLPIWRLFWDE